jgi:hypothetical protein
MMDSTRLAAHRRKILASKICTMLAAAPFSVPYAAHAQTPPNSGTLFDANRQQLSPTETTTAPAAVQRPARIEKETDGSDEGQARPAGGPARHGTPVERSGNQP